MNKVVISIPGWPQRWVRPQQDGRRGSQKNARFTDPKAAAHKRMVAKLLKPLMRGREPWTGPVAISFVAVFAIPESWPKFTKAAARAGRVMHIADPDIDQLLKQIMDAAKGIVFADDNQVCGFVPPFAKRYGHPERTDVVFHLLPQQEDELTPGQRRLEKGAA